MRYLITGGAGFLGAALANRGAEDGHEVVVLDDLSQGDQDRLSPLVTFTAGQITNKPLLWSLLPRVDCVYHLAAKVSVAESLLYPSDYNTINVGGTVALMEGMRDAGVRRVVLASSGSVYGGQAQQPISETVSPQPDSPYAVSKFAAEAYVSCIGRIWNIETVALRIFNAYGPHQPLPVSHAPVVPRFLQQLLTGGSVVLFGDGNQTRDFVYLTDVVDALIAASTAKNINQKVINIGSGTGTSLNMLVDTLEQSTGKKAKRIYNTSKSGGVSQLVADISRARLLLGYRPQVSLEAGVRRILREDARFKS